VNGFGHWIASWIAAPGVDPSTFTPYNKTGVDPAAWKMSIPCLPEDVAWSRELQSMTHLRLQFTHVESELLDVTRKGDAPWLVRTELEQTNRPSLK
jgi:hypothetical protein